jgi:hypothetical protein
VALNIPSFLLPLVLNLIGTLPGLIAQAEAAFSGQSGSGAKKKEFILATAKAMLEAQDMIKTDLMTPAQEASVLATISSVVDAIVSALNTAKLFEPAPGE